MKKLLLACASLLLALGAYGQGQVIFQNTSTTMFTTNGSAIGQGSGNMNAGGNTFRIGLYTAPDGTSNESLFTLAAVATNSPLVAGRWAFPGGTATLAGNNGTAIAFQVRAWSLAGGASYEAAVAAAPGVFPAQTYYGGKSIIGRVTPSVPPNAPPALFGTGDFAGQLTSGVTLVPLVPEPSSIALGLLGLGAIALLRRRK